MPTTVGEPVNEQQVRSILSSGYIEWLFLSGKIRTVSTIPTGVPRKLNEQILLYVSGATKTLYIYDHTGNTWLEFGASAGYTDEEAQDAVGTILTDTNTVDFTYNDGTPSITADVTTQQSITSDGSGVKLSGDEASPGNSQYYGTDSGGTKGFHSLPSGSGGITTIASGSPGSGTTLDITSIPATYGYLVLQITDASSDTGTRELLVQASTDNGSSFDTTAGNYTGFDVTGTTVTAYGKASLIKSATQSAASAAQATITIFNYHAGSWPRIEARTVHEDSTSHLNTANYVGSTSAVDALRILWDGSGNFDGGTYALYGIS